jgi:hypothetical protein
MQPLVLAVSALELYILPECKELNSHSLCWKLRKDKKDWLDLLVISRQYWDY